MSGLARRVREVVVSMPQNCGDALKPREEREVEIFPDGGVSLTPNITHSDPVPAFTTAYTSLSG